MGDRVDRAGESNGEKMGATVIEQHEKIKKKRKAKLYTHTHTHIYVYITFSSTTQRQSLSALGVALSRFFNTCVYSEMELCHKQSGNLLFSHKNTLYHLFMSFSVCLDSF